MAKHGDLQVAIIRKMKLFSPPRARGPGPADCGLGGRGIHQGPGIGPRSVAQRVHAGRRYGARPRNKLLPLG